MVRKAVTVWCCLRKVQWRRSDRKVDRLVYMQDSEVARDRRQVQHREVSTVQGKVNAERRVAVVVVVAGYFWL